LITEIDVIDVIEVIDVIDVIAAIDVIDGLCSFFGQSKVGGNKHTFHLYPQVEQSILKN